MNKGMWKRNLRRGAALALTLVMSLSIAARGAAQERLAAQAAGNAGVKMCIRDRRWAWGTGLWMNRDPKDTKFQTRSKVYRKAGVVRRQAARYFLEYLFRKQNCLEKNR